MTIFRSTAIAALVGVAVVSGGIASARQRQSSAHATCSMQQATDSALQQCPGTTLSSKLGRDGLWTVNVREKSGTLWLVKVNARTCAVVAMTMQRSPA